MIRRTSFAAAAVIALAACSSSTYNAPVATHLPGEKPPAAPNEPSSQPSKSKVVQKGAPAPDFSLSDSTGRTRGRGEFHVTGPAIIIFYHGAWCEQCRKQLERFQSKVPGFPPQLLITAISSDPKLTAAKMVDSLKITFPVLSDPDLETAKAYGVADTVRGLALPAIFVVDKKGIVRWVHIGESTFVEDNALDAARAAAIQAG
jgi:peroxiredoxin